MGSVAPDEAAEVRLVPPLLVEELTRLAPPAKTEDEEEEDWRECGREEPAAGEAGRDEEGEAVEEFEEFEEEEI